MCNVIVVIAEIFGTQSDRLWISRLSQRLTRYSGWFPTEFHVQLVTNELSGYKWLVVVILIEFEVEGFTHYMFDVLFCFGEERLCWIPKDNSYILPNLI